MRGGPNICQPPLHAYVVILSVSEVLGFRRRIALRPSLIFENTCVHVHPDVGAVIYKAQEFWPLSYQKTVADVRFVSCLARERHHVDNLRGAESAGTS